MPIAQHPPDDPLLFIRDCVRSGRVLWTYHVNMRLGERALNRELILGASGNYEIIEAYPDERFLPTYLVWARAEGTTFHVVFATDSESDTVRVVTAYRPDPARWHDDLKTRRTP